jgi:hypothetical protein
MDADVTVSNRLWLELLHAEVCWTLAGQGIDALVIKGPSISQWLYPDGDRESADVDLLLRPSQHARAISALERSGFEDTYTGFRETESSLYTHNLQRKDESYGMHDLDLHHSYPGLEVPPEEAFDVLWRGRVSAQQAGIDVWFPDLEARALIIALHVARLPIEKSKEDLRRAIGALSAPQLDAMMTLASRLNAQAALRAGLETTPETYPFVEQLGLSDVEVPTYWRLLSQGADMLTIEIERIRSLPRRQQVVAMGRWLVPSAASMRARHPEIGDGRANLAWGHVRRWGSGLRRLPGSVAKIRRARGS